MRFEWDKRKNTINLTKHGIDFEAAVMIYEGFVFTFEDTRVDYGENRFVSIGVVLGIEITVVYTPRRGKRRIISARRAAKEERRKYHEELARIENGF